MGRFVTPAGVVIEVSEKAARAVGYKPADAEPKPKRGGRPRKAAAQDEATNK